MSKPAAFDPWKTFDVTPEERAKLEARTKIRDQLKNEFLKKVSDPFRPTKGVIFDPAIQRWYSARMSSHFYFKMTRHSVGYIAMFFVPFFGFGYLYTLLRKEHFRKFKEGEIPYKDRSAFSP